MNPKILVVDDDKEIAEAIAKLLELNNFTVLKAYDGIEALKLVRECEIDLILLDVMMPNLDGMSTLKILREDNNIPVIILSAKSEDYDKVLGLQVGADDYIVKPYNPQELVARVNATIRRYMFLWSKNIVELDS